MFSTKYIFDQKLSGQIQLTNTGFSATLPKNQFGGSSGVRFLYVPPFSRQVTLNYTWSVPASFEPNLGGKLPAFNTDESNTRLMWLRDMTSGRFGARWYLQGPQQLDPGYTKLPGFKADEKYSDSVYQYYQQFTKGDNNVSMSCYLNDIGKPNGIIDINVNGNRQLYDKYVFRTKPATQWTSVLFHVFHGGSTQGWAPSKDNYIEFKNICVYSSS